VSLNEAESVIKSKVNLRIQDWAGRKS
jgi:hypothetical protein